jgi:hypothetical protein
LIIFTSRSQDAALAGATSDKAAQPARTILETAILHQSPFDFAVVSGVGGLYSFQAMSHQHVYPATDTITSSDLREARTKQKVINAKITLFEQSIADLRAESQQIEDGLWMRIEAADLCAILKSKRYGKSLDVRPSLGFEGRIETASMGHDGQCEPYLMVGGYHNNDRFRKGQYFVRRDFGQITSCTA